MAGTLVLNASYEPLCVVPVRRAVVLLLSQKAELVSGAGRPFRSERSTLEVPSVIRLVQLVRVPFRARVRLDRRAVFARDGHRCQYCGGPAESIDHVIPRARGGQHVWENVVAACRPCNTRKGSSLLEDTAMVLRRRPQAPPPRSWAAFARGPLRADWEPYLGPSQAIGA